MNETGSLISIIVPVYNVEKYLRKCLESITNQTYKNIEIICIDDGSPDNSIDILNEFAEKDKRIKIIKQENQGLSGARNTGIRNSTGKYIMFVDSDDWLKNDFCQFAYENFLKYEADILVLPMCSISEEGKILKEFNKNRVHVLNDSEAMENMFSRSGISWCAPSKLYKKELFKEIKFPLGKLMEDKATLYKIYAKCKKIVFIENSKYMYLVRKGSIMRSKFSEKKLQAFNIQLEINKFINQNYPSKQMFANAFTVRLSLLYLCNMSSSDYRNLEKEEEFFHYLDKYKKDFFRCKIIDWRFKILYIYIQIIRKIYKQKIYKQKIYKIACSKVSNVHNRIS